MDGRYTKRVYEEFHNKILGDYYDLYVQIDILLIADVFENFSNKCIEIYKLIVLISNLHLDWHGRQL